jgi:hypothetical protein
VKEEDIELQKKERREVFRGGEKDRIQSCICLKGNIFANIILKLHHLFAKPKLQFLN